ncbi:DnaJ domain-containing protein [Candidatus Kuenenbacteria bacterium]|nr:DnaJ domain-containing protein [Candidatus Kuenenbacteria bacterium]
MSQEEKKLCCGARRFFLFKLLGLFIFLVIIILAAVIFLNNSKQSADNQKNGDKTAQNISLPTEKDIYLTFLDEIYGKIKTNYWKKITDAELTNLYRLALEKITNQPQTLLLNNQTGLDALLKKIMAEMDDSQKKEFGLNLATLVLTNLEPFGRGGLFSEKQTQELENTVQNIDPAVDLYQVLGIGREATEQQITENYQQKSQPLKNIAVDENKTAEEKQAAQEELTLLDRAYTTLKDQVNRQTYNQAGIETSVISKLISPGIFYIHLKKMSPTSFDEFQRAADAMADQPASLNTLILDLRGNIGGSVDLMQWFLGPFIGPGNLAYEFFHQEEYQPFKTQFGWLASLVRYKKVVILIDAQVQSSAEVMAAALKKYNVGVLIGGKTKGWGTIEKIFPLDNQIDPAQKYSMFLAHSLTLREDNQPIESRGVDPTININDPDWDKQLLAYFNYPELVSAVKKIWNEK